MNSTVQSMLVSDSEKAVNKSTIPVIIGSIDINDIEYYKENIQPLKKGHNVKKLIESLKLLYNNNTVYNNDILSNSNELLLKSQSLHNKLHNERELYEKNI